MINENRVLKLPFDTHADHLRTKGKQLVDTIDMHTGGEPLRVILNGAPEIQAGSILEYRRIMQRDHDHFRTALMWEPRGHIDMYGLMLLPPERADSAFGVLFMHNAGYSTMCGHATIAIAKLAVELGWVDAPGPESDFKIDAPCGQLTCRVISVNGIVRSVSFDNVPSFVAEMGAIATLDDGTKIIYDLAYGGAFYAYVDARQFGVPVIPGNTRFFIDKGMEIKRCVAAQSQHISHPYEDDLGFLYGTIFVDASQNEGVHSRNVCMFADGEIDRSATGSGISGRVAIHFARNEIGVHTPITIESIVGSMMSVEVVDRLRYGALDAVIPRVSGDAWITGQHRFIIDPDDPLRYGFLLKGQRPNVKH